LSYSEESLKKKKGGAWGSKDMGKVINPFKNLQRVSKNEKQVVKRVTKTKRIYYGKIGRKPLF